MSWEKIDLWPHGKAGIEAKYRIEDRKLYCMVRGSDHVLDWLHHVAPGAAERERLAAEGLWKKLYRMAAMFDTLTIGGHSLGAVVAAAVADKAERNRIPVVCYAFGGKRPLARPEVIVLSYRHAGDIVPALPPWRPAYKGQEVFGSWRLPWTAHKPEQYKALIKKAGLK